MKRSLLLVALPIGLAALWGASTAGDGRSATVEITADHPTELRGAVISAVTNHGGQRTGEHTNFDDRGTSDLTFTVPVARLEETIAALDGLGGRVTDQAIDLSGAAEQAKGVSGGLTDIESCLGHVKGALGGEAAGSELSKCQDSIAAVSHQLTVSGVDLDAATLEVDIQPAGVSNPALVVAILLLLAGAIGMAILVWRSARLRSDVDLRGLAEYEGDEDLHLRRN